MSITTAATTHPPAYPDWLIADLRSDHAGETGAVMIYRGILAVSRNDSVRRFAERHLATEQRHLGEVAALLPATEYTRLLWLWRPMGFLTGALPALFGPRAVFATIAAVETFVDAHYQEQLDRLAADGPHADLRTVLAACQADEVAHRDEAASLVTGEPGPLLRFWMTLVGVGSNAAVMAARRI